MKSYLDGNILASGTFDTTANPGSLTDFLNTIRELEIGRFLKVCEIPKDEGRVIVQIVSTDVLGFEVIQTTLVQSFQHGQLRPWRENFGIT